MFVLKNTGIYLKNAPEVFEKLHKVIKMGPSRLLIVTDYDKTLTIHTENNSQKVLNSFSMFRLCPSLPQTYKDADLKLYKLYWPIVTDPSLSVEEQSKYMVEWYNIRFYKLLRGIKFPKNELNGIACNISRGSIREGVHRLIFWCELNKVPVVIISAGLGDAVQAALEANDSYLRNVEIISNFLAVDHQNAIIGLKRAIIHHHNKNEAIKKSKYITTLKGRKNAIVMGDELWDAKMTDTIDLESKIKIGFLSSAKIYNLQRYLDIFDIVLVNCQTMNFIIAMLSLMK